VPRRRSIPAESTTIPPESLGLASRIPGRPPRLVVKVGSAVLAPSGVLEPARVRRIAEDLARLAPNVSIVIVSSGAVASGFAALGLDAPPKAIMLKQAAAAVGQSRLMNAWSEAFTPARRIVAQVLLTADDLDDRARHLNARSTLGALLERGIIPIINENDSVSFAEIKLGDNDRLSALVAGLVEADRLIILSTARGLYEGGDAKKIIPVVEDLDAARTHVRAGMSSVGTGGMSTKLDAVATAAAAGVPTHIAPGDEPAIVSRVLAGERVGTEFRLPARGVRARKRWIGFAARARGAITVDAGAQEAITRRGASLLPKGIVSVTGNFHAGAIVDVRTGTDAPFARGRVAYAADEIRLIAGKRADQIESVLGFFYRDEVIHRDDLTLLRAEEASA
jgi:glutamate 5-kinase